MSSLTALDSIVFVSRDLHVSKIVQHTTSNKDRVTRLVKLQDFSYFPNRGEFVCDTDVIKKQQILPGV